jgi:hypothetical protein
MAAMADQTSIGANDGRIQSSVTVGELGPFAIDYPFFSLDDVIVTITDADGDISHYVRGVDYTISAVANGDGIYPSGTVTWLGGGIPVAGTLTRYRQTGLERISQLPLTGFLNRRALNADLNRLMCAMQDFDRARERSLRLPEEDGPLAAVLPPAVLRGNMAFLFDNDGVPYAGALTDATIGVSSYWTAVLQTASRALALAELDVLAPDLDATIANGKVWDFVSARLKAPTRSPGDSGTDVATTAFVQGEIKTLSIVQQKFTGNGTYTPTTGMVCAVIEALGGGGGGGGTAGTGSNTTSTGGGGGAGSLAVKIVTPADVATPPAVTIGAAGTAGAGGGGTGGSGGDSSVGTLCIGKGGSGGAANSAGGLGGAAGTGDLTPTGMPGCNGSGNVTGSGACVAAGGNGGSSKYGGGGLGGICSNANASAGSAGTGKGSGGGGGACSANAGGAAGGAGTAGYVVITEYVLS